MPRHDFKSPHRGIEEPLEADSENASDRYRGFCGKAVKIKVYDSDGMHDHADKWIPVTLGDLPTVWILRGFEWVVPVEILSVLNDTAVESFEHRLMRQPDKDGNIFETIPKIINRFQFQILGEVPWEEYEAFREKLGKYGKEAVKK